MKKIYLILLILPFCFSANAQKFIKIEDKTFNWGGKVGVNAALPIVKSLTIDNQEMEDIRLQYKVGYQAAVFARVNIDRFYIQPSLASVSYTHLRAHETRSNLVCRLLLEGGTICLSLIHI